MTNTKQIKRALLSSVLALILCFTMLLGTTFAWFTDSVTSSGNKIVAGELDVQLYMYNGQEYVDISNSQSPIFGTGALAQNNEAETLWEPGKTQTVYLAIHNAGTLALKYQVALDVTGVEENLHEVMSYIITPDAQPSTGLTRDDLNFRADGVRVVKGINPTEALDVEMAPQDWHYFALSIHMDESAGNEYMNGSITFDLKVLATQLAAEEDSFGPDYDADASYPEGFATAEVNQNGVTYLCAVDSQTNEVLGSANVPVDALVEGMTNVSLNIKEVANDPNFTLSADQAAKSYEITVSGVKEGNTAGIPVQLHVPAGLTGVKLYHKGVEVDGAYYNAERGVISFETTSFSPFVVVYDAEGVYVPPSTEGVEPPKAVVENVTDQYANETIEWGNYGQWSPTEGLEANLDAIYTFTSSETAEEAANSPYANWECDYYVKLDKALGENEIFLGGNYGDFGWIGFHNGEVTLKANEEIALLGSVTNIPWTYAEIMAFVGTFTCGVGNVGDSLIGATFTVTLRLTNPENANETIDVAVINYTFQ